MTPRKKFETNVGRLDRFRVGRILILNEGNRLTFYLSYKGPADSEYRDLVEFNTTKEQTKNLVEYLQTAISEMD